MGSGSTGGGSQQSQPGTLSPITATIWNLFGGNAQASRGQFIPTTFGQGGAFGSSSFSALPELLNNMPLTSHVRVTGAPKAQAALGSAPALPIRRVLSATHCRPPTTSMTTPHSSAATA